MLEYIRCDVEQYGKNGDKTLECIGINISNKGCQEYKCYRFYVEENKMEFPYVEVFEQCSSLRKLDAQKINENMYRINYKVQKINDYEILKNDISHIFFKYIKTKVTAEELMEINLYMKKLLGTREEPLCVIGGKIYENQKIQQLKMYFKLKIFDYKKKKSPFLAADEKYMQLLEKLQEKYRINSLEMKKMEKVLFFSKKMGYESMQLGFNITDKIDEIKYYFRKAQNASKEINDNKEVFPLLNILNIGVSTSLEFVLNTLAKINLELKAFAISYNISEKTMNEIKLYYVEK